MTLDRLLATLRTEEGFCPALYWLNGVPHVGYGHNMTEPLSRSICETILQEDVSHAITEIQRALPWVFALDDVRCRAFVELGFNMGVPHLLGFTKTLACAEAGDWHGAHVNLLDSVWAGQVPPSRRDRIASMLLNGTEL